METIHTPAELHNTMAKTALVAALVGNLSYVQALRAARAIWELSPADFPQIANTIREGQPLGAIWDAKAILSDVPGAWDAMKSIE